MARTKRPAKVNTPKLYEYDRISHPSGKGLLRSAQEFWSKPRTVPFRDVDARFLARAGVLGVNGFVDYISNTRGLHFLRTLPFIIEYVRFLKLIAYDERESLVAAIAGLLDYLDNDLPSFRLVTVLDSIETPRRRCGGRKAAFYNNECRSFVNVKSHFPVDTEPAGRSRNRAFPTSVEARKALLSIPKSSAKLDDWIGIFEAESFSLSSCEWWDSAEQYESTAPVFDQGAVLTEVLHDPAGTLRQVPSGYSGHDVWPRLVGDYPDATPDDVDHVRRAKELRAALRELWEEDWEWNGVWYRV